MWSMPLPPLLNAHGHNVKVKMETESNIFTFNEERSVVLLNTENRNRLFNGKLCPKSKLIFLEVSLESDKKTEISNQKFAISI